MTEKQAEVIIQLLDRIHVGICLLVGIELNKFYGTNIPTGPSFQAGKNRIEAAMRSEL